MGGRVIFGLSVIFLLNLLLRVFYLRYDFVNGDEAVRALTATGMLDGGKLYVDVVTDKPPGAAFFYAAVFSLFGRSMPAVHLAASLWHFGTAVVVFIAGCRFYSKRAGLSAALLFVYFSTAYHTQDMMAANTEMLLALPYTASFYFFVTGRDKPGSLVLAGALTGLAVVFKQIGVFNLVFFALVEAAAASRRGSFKKSAGRLSLVATGFLLVVGLLAASLAATGSIEDFWRNVVMVAARYSMALPPGVWLKFLVTRLSAYVLFNAALWAPAFWAVAGKRREEKKGARPFDLAVALWGLVSLSGVFTSGRFFGHYFIPALPALSLLASRGLLRFLDRLRGPRAGPKERAMAAALAISILFGAVRFHHRTAILAYEAITGTRTRFSEAWGMDRRERESEEVADYVRQRLDEGAPLFIWGYALDVYWKSGCKPASRYLTPYYVTGFFYPDAPPPAEPAADEFWRAARAQLIEDLKRSRPRIILNIDEAIWSLPYPEIVQFVAERYRYRGQLGHDPARPFFVFELRKRLQSPAEPAADQR